MFAVYPDNMTMFQFTMLGRKFGREV